MADRHLDLKREEILQGDNTGVGPLESGRKPSEPLDHVIHHVP